MSYAIQVDSVSITFNLNEERVDSIKEYILRFLQGKLHYRKFEALKNISFDIRVGESVGIIGKNGSGKSTLLKAICGIYEPNTGGISTNGLIAPLIELGAGFDGELTAAENIYLNSAIMGLDKDFVNEKYAEIVDFSELHDFLNVPVKNFSSGMIARLGFALASIISPDILIVDEILGVGDAQFQKKCASKMDELRSNNATMLFVSHDISAVKEICNRIIWISNGEIKMDGSVEEVCSAYEEYEYR